MSDAHPAVNGMLQAAGLRPLGRGNWSAPLVHFAPPELLANAPVAGHGLRVDRAVRRDRYVAVLAYFAPRPTHRSFLFDAAERRAAGLLAGRRVGGRLLSLHGVGDLAPGLVALVPDGRELTALRPDQSGTSPPTCSLAPGVYACC
jgi:hypothetical protein